MSRFGGRLIVQILGSQKIAHPIIAIQMMEFKCSVCYKIFNKKTNLKTHIFSVHGERRCFECLNCNKKFKRKDHLKIHRLHQHENIKKKPFQCDICYVSFKMKANMKKHIIKVHKQVEFWNKFRRHVLNFYKNICGKYLRLFLKSTQFYEVPKNISVLPYEVANFRRG